MAVPLCLAKPVSKDPSYGRGPARVKCDLI